MHSIRRVATRCDWEDIFVAHQITFVGLQVFVDSHFSLVLLLCGPIISKGLVSSGRAWLHRLLERRVWRLLRIQKRQTRNVTTRVLWRRYDFLVAIWQSLVAGAWLDSLTLQTLSLVAICDSLREKSVRAHLHATTWDVWWGWPTRAWHLSVLLENSTFQVIDDALTIDLCRVSWRLRWEHFMVTIELGCSSVPLSLYAIEVSWFSRSLRAHKDGLNTILRALLENLSWLQVAFDVILRGESLSRSLFQWGWCTLWIKSVMCPCSLRLWNCRLERLLAERRYAVARIVWWLNWDVVCN